MRGPEVNLFNSLNLDQKQEVVLRKFDFVPGERIAKNCQECGACCLALSIRLLKGTGSPCPNLEIKDGKFACRDYKNRPDTCREYDCREEKTNTASQRERVRELFSARTLNASQLKKTKITGSTPFILNKDLDIERSS